MAKKKTENIKAAPVLRADVGGDQPTPTPEQTGTRTYQIMDPWKDRDKVNLVDVKSVNGEITDVKVNGVPAGGGGGGVPMFNITWNITNGPASVLPTCVLPSGQLCCAVYDPQTSKYQTYNEDKGAQEIADGEHTLKYACFYPNGKIFIDFENGVNGNVTGYTGNVTYDDMSFTISGDCSISITIS